MSATGEIDPRQRPHHGYAPRAGAAGAAGANLRRYGRFVGLAKWLLLAIAMLVVLAVLAWPGAFTNRGGFQLGFASLENVDGSLTMVSPRYTGTDNAGRPFVITAESAQQDELDQQRVTMHTLQADVTMTDGTWLSLSAEKGLYDRTRQTLRLDGPIDIFSDRGYEFHGTGAEMDLAAGVAVTTQPVQGHGPFGALRANRMTVKERGQYLLFEGDVRTTLLPRKDRS
ncbi:MAG: LPS export ABC transporter periplasmic protein LptC [Alphaproteobacteria bacterium]